MASSQAPHWVGGADRPGLWALLRQHTPFGLLNLLSELQVYCDLIRVRVRVRVRARVRVRVRVRPCSGSGGFICSSWVWGVNS